MTLGIMQPYFLPYIGYFQLINAVDKYVVYNDVNYIKGGWINRNKILINGQPQWLTLKLKGASPNKLISEIEIADDFTKLRKTIDMAYHKAINFEDGMTLMDKILKNPERRLDLFLYESLIHTCSYLGIKTDMVLSSDIEKDMSLSGEKKVIDICKRLNADSYLNAIGGQELYSYKNFNENGLSLSFLKPNASQYKQYGEKFVPFLSIIDVIMHKDKEYSDMLKDYFCVERNVE